jgi:AcrR family transcriptional regulator
MQAGQGGEPQAMTERVAGLNTRGKPLGARRRIIRTAYKLFTRNPVGSVGIDTIIEQAGVAKMSLYRHFQSKEALVLEVLRHRDALWTLGWLKAEVLRRTEAPEERLLAVFEIFHEWFQRRDFEGCTFINVLLEAAPKSPLHRAAAGHLAEIRSILSSFATDAGLADVDRFTQIWHILMKGSIVAAREGNREAALHAANAGRLILGNWPRATPAAAPQGAGSSSSRTVRE